MIGAHVFRSIIWASFVVAKQIDDLRRNRAVFIANLQHYFPNLKPTQIYAHIGHVYTIA
jgi:hypothetical protein